MRRPTLTKAQRQHAKQQRALLQLRRAAVKWSTEAEYGTEGDDDGDALINALTDLQIAADKYREVLTKRELKKLLK